MILKKNQFRKKIEKKAELKKKITFYKNICGTFEAGELILVHV
jgi:hypothetical protein